MPHRLAHTHTHTHTLNLLPEDASHIFGSTWIDGQICCEVTGFLLENVFLSQTLCPISSGSLQDCGCVMKSHREQALKGLLTQRSHLETVARFKKKIYTFQESVKTQRCQCQRCLCTVLEYTLTHSIVVLFLPQHFWPHRVKLSRTDLFSVTKFIAPS